MPFIAQDRVHLSRGASPRGCEQPPQCDEKRQRPWQLPQSVYVLA